MPNEDCSRNCVPGEYIDHRQVFLRHILLCVCGRSSNQFSSVAVIGRAEGRWGRAAHCG